MSNEQRNTPTTEWKVDAADVAEADRIMAASDPTKRRTLDELRTAIAEARNERDEEIEAAIKGTQ